MTGHHHTRTPRRREPGQPEQEYAPLRIPAEVSGTDAAAELAIRAEYGGWELATMQRFADGTRKALLRRRRHRGATPLPGLTP